MQYLFFYLYRKMMIYSFYGKIRSPRFFLQEEWWLGDCHSHWWSHTDEIRQPSTTTGSYYCVSCVLLFTGSFISFVLPSPFFNSPSLKIGPMLKMLFAPRGKKDEKNFLNMLKIDFRLFVFCFIFCFYILEDSIYLYRNHSTILYFS